MFNEKNKARDILEMVVVGIVFYLFAQTPVGAKIASALGFASTAFGLILLGLLVLALVIPILKMFFDFFNR